MTDQTPQTTTEPVLLPCPFCGGEADRMAAMGESWVRCMTCNAATEMFGTDTAAIAAWNTRTTPQPLAVGLDRARVESAVRDSIVMTEGGTCVDVQKLTDALAAPAEGYVLVPVERLESILLDITQGAPGYARRKLEKLIPAAPTGGRS